MSITEALEAKDPMVELLAPVRVTQLFIFFLEDFVDLTHDNGKDGHTNDHAENGDNHFKVTYGVLIAISDC